MRASAEDNPVECDAATLPTINDVDRYKPKITGDESKEVVVEKHQIDLDCFSDKMPNCVIPGKTEVQSIRSMHDNHVISGKLFIGNRISALNTPALSANNIWYGGRGSVNAL